MYMYNVYYVHVYMFCTYICTCTCIHMALYMCLILFHFVHVKYMKIHVHSTLAKSVVEEEKTRNIPNTPHPNSTNM